MEALPKTLKFTVPSERRKPIDGIYRDGKVYIGFTITPMKPSSRI